MSRRRASSKRRESPPVGPRAVALHWQRRLAAERGTPRIVPPAPCQVALVYPSSYRVGMASLGYQMVYRWLNEHRATLAERFFCEGRPSRSVENQRPVGQFDVVAFSAAFELEYLDAVRFLIENGVGLFAEGRDPVAEPIVLVGGVCLLVNRLPIYDLADVLVVGDGEQLVGRIADQWEAGGGDRRRFLRALVGIEGVEVTEGAARRFGLDLPAGAAGNTDPNRPARPRPHFVPALDSTDACSVIVTPDAEFGDRWLVELSRGCPYRCRFCLIGNCMPYRVRSADAVREMIERGRPLTKRFGLVAGAVGSHPEIDGLCEWCLRAGLDVSFSSLRVEDVTAAMLELLVSGGQKSVTIAPEAGSERLRRQLGKRLPDECVVEFAAEATRRGLTDLRLYFMVGLPGERTEDIEAIAHLVKAARRAAVAAKGKDGGRVAVAVNLSVFVPKPETPFATAELPAAAEIKRRASRLGALLRGIEGVQFRLPSLGLAQVQRALAWGDRRMLPLLIDAAHAGAAWRRVLVEAAASGGLKPGT